jgi:hypothetical protein
VRDEIKIATKKIKESTSEGNKYGEMVRSMVSTKQGNKESSGLPAAKAPWQPQAAVVGGKRKLQREGAIADINTLFDQEIVAIDPDQLAKCSNNDP